MKIAFFDTHAFEKTFFEKANQDHHHTLIHFETRLTPQTASLAEGARAVCCFVNDKVNAETLQKLSEHKIELVALRSAGFNNVDLKEAERLKIKVVRVPEYSPYAVAEHAVALMLTLNRKIHRASSRVHEGNFSLNGLVGFDLHGKTVGIIGTGKIGAILVKIMTGFGCEVLLYDQRKDESLVKNYGATYVSLDELFKRSDIISLHVPLNPATRYLLNQAAFEKMKKGVMIINTGRGALIDTRALISSLKDGKIGYAGLDVYEEEEGIFFEDLSGQVLQDDTLARLMSFPNVILTSHQAFLTQEALTNIAETTIENITAFEKNLPLANEVSAEINIR